MVWGNNPFFCAAIGGKILKKIFDRDRPAFLQLIEKTNESFPSGHATATTIFYGFIGLVLILTAVQIWKKSNCRLHRAFVDWLYIVYKNLFRSSLPNRCTCRIFIWNSCCIHFNRCLFTCPAATSSSA